MSLIKLKKSASKRFILKNKTLKRKRAFLRHILTKKSSKKKRFLGKSCWLSKSDLKLFKKIKF